ncbi:MAG: carboxymuconolactone decarboxylase family protein [Candidatus Latescibacteria bacterium]|nr:carboxymuconolactone decarboxylase family protein [Candidatus Latescibacterota bacterium]
MALLKSREASESVTKELARMSPEITAGITKMRQVAYASGEVPGKYKLLTAAAISVAIRCEPCIRAYVEWAAKKGASKQELIEFLNVAMTMQGCPGEEWSLKALQAYDELIEGKAVSSDGCCAH